MKFIRRGRNYLTLLPQLVSGEGYWKHIALVPSLVRIVQGPDFRKILRQSYDNLSIFVRNASILRQTFDDANFRKIL